MTSVLICEDHREARDRLAAVLGTLRGVSRVRRCGTAGSEVLAHYNVGANDLVLLGIHSGIQGGLSTLRALLTVDPAVSVIVFGAAHDPQVIAATVAFGARGYLRWDLGRPHAIAPLVHASTVPAPPGATMRNASPLSEREQQVLLGMSEGKSNGQIGRELFLSEDTIKTHARRLFRKLHVGDRAEAVAHGFRHALLT